MSTKMAIPFGEPGSATTDSTIDNIYDSYGVPRTPGLQPVHEPESRRELQDFASWEAERLASAKRREKLMAGFDYEAERKKAAEGRARAIARGMAVRDIGTPPISDDGESGSEADSSTPRARAETSVKHDRVDSGEEAVTFLNPPGTPRTIMMNIEVKLRLLSAVHFLTKTNQTAHDRNEATRIAAETRTFVTKCKGTTALEARCQYYIAIAHNDDPKIPSNDRARRYHELAREATLGGYPEGRWAGQWLNHWERLNNQRSPTAKIASWAYSTAVSVISYVRGSSTTPSKPSRSDSEQDPFGRDRQSLSDISPIEGGGERIPSFSTWRSSDAGSPQAASPEAGMFPYRRSTKDSWSLKGGKGVALQGAFQPSFNSGNEALSPTPDRLSNSNPLSASSTRSQFGLAWSKHHPYGKGDIIPGKTFDSVSSPENISSESERNIPHNVLGGLVDLSRLNAKKTEMRGREWEARRRSYVPEGVSPLQKIYVVQNMLAGHDSPLSDLSPSSDSSIPVIPASYKRHTYSGQHNSYTGADPSAPNSASDSSSSYPYNASAVGNDKSVIPVGAGSDSPRKRRMGSLSVIATGLDLAGVLPHRRRSEMAAPEQKLEEGESPFSPKRGDGGIYVTEEGIVEEEV
ncbi:hypothetical protein B0A48_04981 [Cryoendolithus antarcticus]|uniref:Uncharacterized protein n=1 Tax=Cryoendolithus antarcticus TaxID=1507870 RepID=A0A1V8TDX2_9PEZI|nr:hypothetical protein B0A48_04981 [Cryoendolithus antarcticus]